MGADGKAPVVETAVRSWTDAFRAIAAMPMAAAIGLACAAVLSLAGNVSMEILQPTERSVFLGHEGLRLPTQIVDTVQGLLYAVTIAPLAIAVHRYVLLGEVTRGYPFGPGNVRFMRYAGFAIGLSLLLSIPAYYEHLSNLLPLSDWFLLGSALVVKVIFLVVAMNHMLLFPAVAVDVEPMGWRQARRVMRGHAWRAFFIMLCFVLPIVLLALGLFYFDQWVETYIDIAPQAVWLRGQIAGIVMLCGFASATANLYRAFDPTLGREPLPTVAAAS